MTCVIRTLAGVLALFDVAPGADDRTWVADPSGWDGELLFGGVLVGQAVAAAGRAAPGGRRVHSLHGYFLRPATSRSTLAIRVTPIREGRAFASARVEVSQQGRAVFDATCSYTADLDGGYVYDLPPLDPTPPPGEIPPEDEWEGPWDARWLGPGEPAADGTRSSTHRHWFRWPDPLPDVVHLHAALFGYASDWTGVGGRPLHLEGDTTGMVSLDHAVWFHRPANPERWHLIDVHSLVNAGGRGLLRAAIRDEAGRVVVSVAQEMLLTPQ